MPNEGSFSETSSVDDDDDDEYDCEHDCGFVGTYEEVSKHEPLCKHGLKRLEIETPSGQDNAEESPSGVTEIEGGQPAQNTSKDEPRLDRGDTDAKLTSHAELSIVNPCISQKVPVLEAKALSGLVDEAKRLTEQVTYSLTSQKCIDAHRTQYINNKTHNTTLSNAHVSAHQA